jgi:hypothetical protein
MPVYISIISKVNNNVFWNPSATWRSFIRQHIRRESQRHMELAD